MRSIATVAPLRNGVVGGGCTTVPVGSLPISPPEDDLRDAKRLKVCSLFDSLPYVKYERILHYSNLIC